MTSTIWLVTLFFGLLLISLLLQALFLRWGLKWAKVAGISFGKAVLLAVVLSVASLLITFGFAIFTPTTPLQEIASGLGQLASQVVVACAILAHIFRTKLWRALAGWLPTLIPGMAMLAFTYLVLRPFLYEAFTAPTNSMAPTLLGKHCSGICPRCGAPAYGSVPEPRVQMPTEGWLLICSKELRSCRVTEISGDVGQSDRFMVSKLLSPRRWDVVVFRLPSDRSVFYVKRLVGLPGEELLLRDGAVWINGQELEPPEPLRGIEYLSAIEWGNSSVHTGAGSAPVKLGLDEYFVLGDFSAQASDSRFWQTGAPGHSAYAVPESHIVGVVTHIYWPLDRLRILR